MKNIKNVPSSELNFLSVRIYDEINVIRLSNEDFFEKTLGKNINN